MSLPLLYISLISFGTWFFFLYKIWEIQFLGHRYNRPTWSDNEIMVYAARHAGTWRWPSDMHKMGLRYTHMKDVTILLIALFQRIMGDKNGPRPLIAAFSFPIPVTTVLVYLLGTAFWSSGVGLFVSLIYLSCIWPWQLSLFGGHLNVATMFVMLGFWAITYGYLFFMPWLNIWLIVAGIFFGCMFFSSASWFRFIPMIMAILFYVQHPNPGIYKSLRGLTAIMASNYSPLIHVWGVITLAIGLILLWASYSKLISAAYRFKWPLISNKARERYTVSEYKRRTLNKIITLSYWVGALYALFMIFIFIVGVDISKFIFLGFAPVFLILMFPNFISNIQHYMEYVYGAFVVMDTGFRTMAAIGHPDYKNISKRGAGFKWIPRLYWRMIPIHAVMTLGLTATSTILIALHIYQLPWLAFIFIVLTGFSPILWAELTGAVQIGRPYASGLTGFLILIGFGAFVIVPHLNHPLIWAGVAWLITATYNLYIFTSDVFPARMVSANLLTTLRKLNIKEFSTYDTYYNYSFIGVIDPDAIKKFKIHYIKKMHEALPGWILVPPTSCKSTASSAAAGEPHLDFTEDIFLNQLFETRQIEKIATAKFKSRGTSRIWPQEGEIASFRDLILHDISDYDRLRGHGWLINTNNLPNSISVNNAVRIDK